MTCTVRAKLSVTQMRRGRLHASSCRHEQPVDGPYRPSGRNASPSGTIQSTIMSPTQSNAGSWTEIRLSTRAHTSSPNDPAHAPPTTGRCSPSQTATETCAGMHAQIRSVAAPH